MKPFPYRVEFYPTKAVAPWGAKDRHWLIYPDDNRLFGRLTLTHTSNAITIACDYVFKNNDQHRSFRLTYPFTEYSLAEATRLANTRFVSLARHFDEAVRADQAVRIL